MASSFLVGEDLAIGHPLKRLLDELVLEVGAAVGSGVASDNVDVVSCGQCLQLWKFPNSRASRVLQQEEVAELDLGVGALDGKVHHGHLPLSDLDELAHAVLAGVVEVLVEDGPCGAFYACNEQKWAQASLRISPKLSLCGVPHVVPVDDVEGLTGPKLVGLGLLGDLGTPRKELHDVDSA